MADLIKPTQASINKNFLLANFTAEQMYQYLRKTITDKQSIILREMQYHVYLTTLYWHIISNYYKWKQRYKCEKCGRTHNLNIHHQNYDNRGYEYLDSSNLICLCRSCHLLEHIKPEDCKKQLESLAVAKKANISIPDPIENPNYDPYAMTEIKRMLAKNEVV